MKFLCLLIPLILSCELRDRYRCNYVDRVGGCDGFGNCGVMFANRTKGIVKFPVVGEKACDYTEVK